ncbi:hypothetical protein LPB19_00450 [Marinobacter salinisoli]|uniref:MipA/OmpV family protein n=1 Tax=Marinobacter salinisoli TaxID=2769486 RepID=A0ABX7MRE8_9GAMM|nr:hypothetical protein [Marinobacter salinisoli]QSP94932.1 hypothetical protein LPB19_00450 [Marinobacter salinisoli]
MSVTLRTCLIPALMILFVPWASAADSSAGYGSGPTEKDHVGEKEYSAYLNIGYPQSVFWGDT